MRYPGQTLIAAKAVLARYGGICGMTLHRWVRDPDLNFPKRLLRYCRLDEAIDCLDFVYAQHFRPGFSPREPGNGGYHRDQRPYGNRPHRPNTRSERRAHGHHDAGYGWIRDHSENPRGSTISHPPDPGAHREGNEGRPREMPRRRRKRLHLQTGGYRSVAVGDASMAVPLK